MAKTKEDDFVTVKTMRAILLETIGDKLDSRLDRIKAKLETFGSLKLLVVSSWRLPSKMKP